MKAISPFRILPLGELCENFDYKRRPVKAGDRRPGPYPYYGAQGIVDYVDEFLFDGDYVLVAEDGENLRSRKERIAVVAGGKFWVNNHAHVIKGNTKTDTRFLYYALNFADIAGYVTGSTIPKLSQSSMNRLLLPCPPLKEQQAITSILGTLDDKINLNRRMNETLEAMARAIFNDWFVDFGPVHAKAEGRQPPGLTADIAVLFPDALGQEGMPLGWSKSPLVKLTSKIGSGATPKGGRSVYVEEGINLIRSQNVYDHNFAWEGLAKLSDEAASRLVGVTVARDDILINITGDSILRTCVVDPTVLPARVNQHVAIVRARKGIPSRFLHLFLVQASSKVSLLGYDAGGSRAAVTKGHLELFPVLLPTTGVLEAFEQLVAPLFQRVDSNRAESRTLAALRDLLLPKLMSGEIRLRDAERAVEAAA